MKTTFLDFEQSISELEAKIEELRFVQDDSALDISEEIRRLQKKSQTLTKDIYAKLTSWQISQVARHPRKAASSGPKQDQDAPGECPLEAAEGSEDRHWAAAS